MSQETELQQLHESLNKIKGSLRRTMVVMLILLAATLISFVYGYLQQIEASRQFTIANQADRRALSAQAEAEHAMAEMVRQKAISAETINAAEKSAMEARQLMAELEKCRRGRK